MVLRILLAITGVFSSISPAQAGPPWRGARVTIPLEAARTSLALPQISGPAGRPLVVLDPGHGGHDPGAISPYGGTEEKQLTLAVARQIRAELLASGRVRVALTRDADMFLALRERTAIARNLKAALFISIHADSASGQATGGQHLHLV